MNTIRQITEPHGPDSEFIRELARVFCEARKERLQFLIDLHDMHEDRRFLSAVILPENQVWVAEVDGKLAGFLAFANGWINHLYITPEFQHQGLGRQLLAVARASNPVLQLWVFEINIPAIKFYEYQGFRIMDCTDGATNEAKMPDVRMEWRSEELLI